MHINEVERILRESVSGQENRYEIRRYCDHICCESDFVLLRDGLEYAYFKFDETGRMSRKAMGIREEKMGTASFYVVLRDTDASCSLRNTNACSSARYWAAHQEHRRGYVAIPALLLCSVHCLRDSRACAVRYA